MTTTSLDSYIGFAVRSRKAVFGAEGLLAGRTKVFVVLYDAALGKDGGFDYSLLDDKTFVDTFSNMPQLQICGNREKQQSPFRRIYKAEKRF